MIDYIVMYVLTSIVIVLPFFVYQLIEEFRCWLSETDWRNVRWLKEIGTFFAIPCFILAAIVLMPFVVPLAFYDEWKRRHK